MKSCINCGKPHRGQRQLCKACIDACPFDVETLKGMEDAFKQVSKIKFDCAPLTKEERKRLRELGYK